MAILMRAASRRSPSASLDSDTCRAEPVRAMPARSVASCLAAGFLAIAATACAPGAGAQSGVAAGGAGNGLQGVEWQAPLLIASADAEMGPWRMNQSRFHYVDDPAVAVTAAGITGVAWVDNRRKDVFFQRFTPDGRPLLEAPVNVSRSPEIFSWLPKLVLAGGEQVFVLWQEIVFSGGSHGGEIFFAHSDDGGQSFSAPQNLSNSEAGDGKGRLTPERWHNGSLDLARADDGTLYAAWTEYEGALWLSRTADGMRFGAPRRIAGSPERPARALDLAVGPAGRLYLAWTFGEDDAANIHLSVSNDGGYGFSEPRELFAADAHADAPKLAVDSAGAVHLVYAQGQRGPFGPNHIRYGRLDAAGDPVIDAKRISGPARELRGGAGFPYLALDGRDTVVVLWEHYPDFASRPYGLGIAVSRNRGQDFSAPALVPSTTKPGLGFNGSLQGMLMQKLAVNDRGLIRIANSRFDPNEQSLVRLLRARLTAP
jgi:hypothetical protein